MYGAVGNTPHRKSDPFDPALSQFPQLFYTITLIHVILEPQ